MELKAVLFDLDGVITDTAKFHFDAWKYIANKYQIDLPEEFEENLKGVDRTMSFERILEYGNVKLTDEEFEEALVKKNSFYVESLQALGEDDILPGIKQLFDELQKNDIKIVIASISRNAPQIILKLNLKSYIHAIANPESVQNSKPAPDIFLEAARLSGFDKSQCIGIEDALAGVEALNNAEIISVGIGENLTNADVVLKSTSELTYELLSNMISE